VYITASRSGVLYVGVTNDLERRIGEHQAGAVRSFTSRYRCFRLVYAEPFASVLDAIAFEKKLKGWRRSKKVALINRDNPEWADLSGLFRSSSYHPERFEQLAHNREG
jgi:putative endonuclease